MNIHFEDVPCPCPWCRLSGQRDSLHRIRRMWTEDKPMSAESKAVLDDIVKRAIAEVEGAQRR